MGNSLCLETAKCITCYTETMSTHATHPWLVIHSSPAVAGGKGLFTTTCHEAGQVVHVLTGETFAAPTRETIHIGNGLHIYDDFGIFMNHSFQPNVEIRGTQVVAVRDIAAGEELTFDYNASEIDMAAPFEVNGVRVAGKSAAAAGNA